VVAATGVDLYERCISFCENTDEAGHKIELKENFQ